MKRFFLVGVLILGGCQLPPERAVLQPLPSNGPPLPYAQLLTRVRNQAKAANEAFYVDRWGELEELANGIEQTAVFLGKAEDVPPNQKSTLGKTTSSLSKDAVKLRDAAKAKDVKNANAAMQRITLAIHELRLDK
jgi:hypothetical protein